MDLWRKNNIIITTHVYNLNLNIYCRFLLLVVSFLELMTGAAINDQSRGSGRVAGDFNFDPLGLSKNPAAKSRYLTNEIKNGRLAMLAFAGIVTQAALFPEKSFPYLP